MPTTRARTRVAEDQPQVDVEGAAGPRQTRQRNSARARANRAHPRRSRSSPNLQDGHFEEEVFHDDEEPDIGKTLHAKDGKVSLSFKNHFLLFLVSAWICNKQGIYCCYKLYC